MYSIRLRQHLRMYGQDQFCSFEGTVVAKYSRYFNSDHIDAQLTVEVLYEYLTLLKGLRRKQEWVDIVGARYNMADREKKERLDLQVMPISGCHVKVLLNAVCMWQMSIRRRLRSA